MRGNLNFFVSVLVRKVDKMAFLAKVLTTHVLHLRSVFNALKNIYITLC